MQIALVGCAKQKLSRAARARDLYTSPSFADRRVIAESEFDRWFVLSGEHGLLSPDRVVEPYEKDLNEASTRERRIWADHVLDQLEEELGPDVSSYTFEILAGSAYCDFGLNGGLQRKGARVEWPVQGLSQGLQKAYYAQRAAGTSSEKSISPAKVSPIYRHLYEHLSRWEDNQVSLAFARIEELIARPLPPSARKHRAWWSSSAARSAWTAAGWTLTRIDRSGEIAYLSRPPKVVASIAPPPTDEGVDELDAQVAEAVAYLSDATNTEPAATFPTDAGRVRSPGLYAWYCDEAGQEALTRSLEMQIDPLIYAGQAGAGKEKPTIYTRIIDMHLWERIEFSTFRLTLTSILCNRLGLQVVGPKLLDVESEARLTSWMKRHLSVATFPLGDRSTLGEIETRVLRLLDPPLNLKRMALTPTRSKVKSLRAVVGQGRCPQGYRCPSSKIC